MKTERLPDSFFTRDVLMVAPELLGKQLVRIDPQGKSSIFIISETEAYRGTDDRACHAHKGRTPRTEVMFRKGGVLYMYLVYGMHWMLNIVTQQEDIPQAVLIRGVKGISGPGRLTRAMGLDGSFNGEELQSSQRIWIAESGIKPVYTTHPRVGIDYAGDYWKNVPWRFVLEED